jgi:hypothetical protein
MSLWWLLSIVAAITIGMWIGVTALALWIASPPRKKE